MMSASFSRSSSYRSTFAHKSRQRQTRDSRSASEAHAGNGSGGSPTAGQSSDD
jgi:hypothetical protein